MKAKEHIYQTILGFFLLLIALAMVVPFLYVIVISFTDASVYESGKFMLWPEKWSTAAYELILSGSGFLNALKSTLIITFIGTPLSVAVNAGLAYMLSKPIPGKGFLNKYVMFTMLFSAGMVPNYILFRTLHLTNTIFALIFSGMLSSFNLFLIKNYFETLPEVIEEAARIDGASNMRTFFSVVLPMSTPVLATVTLYYAVGYWSNYFAGVMYITDASLKPLQQYMFDLVTQATSLQDTTGSFSDVNQAMNVSGENIRSATIVVSTIPILCVYPFLQKYFVKGITIGSVKG